MNALGEGEALLETVVPAARGARWVAYAVAGLLVAGLIGFVVWWVLVRPASAQQAAAQARVAAVVSSATAGAAQDTVHTIVIHDQAAAAISAQTQENDHAIRSAPGATTPVDPGFTSALHSALCMRGSYQREPDCAALHGDGGSVGAAEPDAWSTPPDGLVVGN